MPHMLRTYDEFVKYIEDVGFMTLSANPLGFPSLWELTDEAKWWTGTSDDPWNWRVRIAEERRAAYAKLFHGQPSFITREWYPFFFAVRRGGRTFEDAWEAGLMTAEAKRIYDLFGGRSVLALHEIKRLGGFGGKAGGRFESALKSLQEGMFLTASGMTRMTTTDGRPHSWPVTEYMRTENWAWPGVMEAAAALRPEDALERISARIKEMLPEADQRKIERFIGA
jgi:hypothetical protein